MKRQTHTIRVVFPGHFEDFVNYLDTKGVKFDFVPPGLKGSDSVLEVFPIDFITSAMYEDDGVLMEEELTEENRQRVIKQYNAIKGIK